MLTIINMATNRKLDNKIYGIHSCEYVGYYTLQPINATSAFMV
jgi:hypothetical protein